MPKGTIVFCGDNVAAELDGNTLVIRLDVSKRLRPSRSTMNADGSVNPPKSTIIATTGGNKPIGLPGGDVGRLSLTCYVPIARAVETA